MRVRDLRVACGLDWGNSAPGCIVWGAALPDGHVHLFDELKFQRMTAKMVAEAFTDKCREWKIKPTIPVYCDPSILPAKKGDVGEWIGLTLIRHGIKGLQRVSNDRVNGWQRVHEALAASPDGTPWLTMHPRCRYLARTFPLQVQDEHDPEDLDTTGDEHGMDGIRYLFVGGLRPGSARRATPTRPGSWGAFKRQYGTGRAA